MQGKSNPAWTRILREEAGLWYTGLEDTLLSTYKVVRPAMH